MESHWAVEHLQVIRTLMERAALYRRALAPIMLAIGFLGLAAALAAWLLRIDSSRSFGLFWGGVALAGLGVAFRLIRRQAGQESEPFWSPPTRRVTQAMLPAMAAGLVTVLLLCMPRGSDPLPAWWMPPIWMVLYGASVHAAGFFMPRGIKLFGWIFVAAGSATLIALGACSSLPPIRTAHWLMGAVFGGFHAAYGAYLYLTESRKPTA